MPPAASGSVLDQASPAGESSNAGSPSASADPPAGDWADVVDEVKTSTVRLEISTCDNGHGMGSGFLVGDNLVMTAAHVVGEAASVTLQADGLVSSARVIEIDYGADVALLRSERSFSGGALALAEEKPRIGTELAVLGFPNWAQDLRVTRGIVSSNDYHLRYRDFEITNDVMVTDAAINGGNSGGPVIDRRGQVIGLVTGKELLLADHETVSEGTAFVVPSTDLDDRLEQWRSRGPGEGMCGEEPDAVENAPLIRAEYRSDHPDAADLTQVLALHGENINRGDYESAYTLFTPSMRNRQVSWEEWSAGLRTSLWTYLSVDEVSRENDTATVEVRFRTQQDQRFGPDGQTCSDWSQARVLKLVDDQWLIHQVTTSQGSPTPC